MFIISNFCLVGFRLMSFMTYLFRKRGKFSSNQLIATMSTPQLFSFTHVRSQCNNGSNKNQGRIITPILTNYWPALANAHETALRFYLDSRGTHSNDFQSFCAPTILTAGCFSFGRRLIGLLHYLHFFKLLQQLLLFSCANKERKPNISQLFFIHLNCYN